jgi:hypothetical protein
MIYQTISYVVMGSLLTLSEVLPFVSDTKGILHGLYTNIKNYTNSNIIPQINGDLLDEESRLLQSPTLKDSILKILNELTQQTYSIQQINSVTTDASQNIQEQHSQNLKDLTSNFNEQLTQLSKTLSSSLTETNTQLSQNLSSILSELSEMSSKLHTLQLESSETRSEVLSKLIDSKMNVSESFEQTLESISNKLKNTKEECCSEFSSQLESHLSPQSSTLLELTSQLTDLSSKLKEYSTQSDLLFKNFDGISSHLSHSHSAQSLTEEPKEPEETKRVATRHLKKKT